jgi:hypothetical protein
MKSSYSPSLGTPMKERREKNSPLALEQHDQLIDNFKWLHIPVNLLMDRGSRQYPFMTAGQAADSN